MQDGGGKHKPRRQRVEPAIGPEWEEPPEPTIDSLPRRARTGDIRDIQRPEGRTPGASTSSSTRRQSRRATADMRVNEGLPRALTRSATVPYGREAEAEALGAGGEEYITLRTRRRRSRSGSRSGSPDGGPIASSSRTPGSALLQRSSRDSRRSSRSSSSRRAPSVESASSVSIDLDQRVTRRHKGRDEVVVFPASPPQVPDPPTATKPRKHRKRRESHGVEDDSGKHHRTRRGEPLNDATAALPRMRHRDHSDSPSGSRRRHTSSAEIKPASSNER